MSARSFFKMIMFTSVLISLSTMNVLAVDFSPAKNLNGKGSSLFNPVFPDVQMPDFQINANTSTPGIDYSESAGSIGPDYEKLHKYSGLATIALAGIAAVTSSNESLHYGAAYAATGAALFTCWSGYEAYSDRFDLEEGLLAQDNLHILLGVIGTVAIVTSVATADSGDESSHAGMGVAGGSMMLASVVILKIDF